MIFFFNFQNSVKLNTFPECMKSSSPDTAKLPDQPSEVAMEAVVTTHTHIAEAMDDILAMNALNDVAPVAYSGTKENPAEVVASSGENDEVSMEPVAGRLEIRVLDRNHGSAIVHTLNNPKVLNIQIQNNIKGKQEGFVKGVNNNIDLIQRPINSKLRVLEAHVLLPRLIIIENKINISPKNYNGGLLITIINNIQ